MSDIGFDHTRFNIDLPRGERYTRFMQ